MIKQTTLLSILFIIIILIAACNNNEDGSPPPTPIQLENTLVIKSNETNEKDRPMLSWVRATVSNSDGTVYILSDNTFHIYDKEGKWKNSFGGSGSGPGEFEQVVAVYVDSNDRILVADLGNARISIFDKDGQFIDAKSTSDIRFIISIREMPDGRFILTGHSDGKLVHIYNNDLTKRQASFISVEDLSEREAETELNWMQHRAGYAEPINNNLIAFVPSIYHGVLYLYEKNDAGEWVINSTIKSYNSSNNIDPVISFSSSEPAPINGERSYDGMIALSSGRIYIAHQSQSFGLYQIGESIFHLSYLKTEDNNKPMLIERFNPKTKSLEEYALIDSIELRRQNPAWMDGQKNIYLIDNSEIPEVWKMKFSFEQ